MKKYVTPLLANPLLSGLKKQSNEVLVIGSILTIYLMHNLLVLVRIFLELC
ncbi:MAG TPA: hypothetical protein VK750_04285 [Cytophagaceae bacterium]|jgi:hypothetical protein|nr:hypothetical protein [Cytophagaceae bacterium]